MTLLIGDPKPPVRHASAQPAPSAVTPAPTTSQDRSAAPTPSTAPTTAQPTGPAPASTQASASADHQDLGLPGPVADTARRFTLAWATHDARPGADTAYQEAARRAAPYTAPDLAAELAASRQGADRVWEQWRAHQTRITAEVTAVTIPDGAPSPTETRALARVHYRLTIAPTDGQPTTTDEQVALELRRGTDGTWRVTALPNA
ncbi:hypothetical protein OG689_44480 [Kitasatospora sp. NBC_00240]|uniref:hypothetical protein n=1 Tax=Kitasatospora sp. NBC_00240 TaxID=2903567 RepID=UPI00225407A5|nr:hypothetical protein [Kitasatospora sp. NBC_00240]MCX5216196.1 hypothetical protein [Kitasatospora sp. NBC_00240]